MLKKGEANVIGVIIALGVVVRVVMTSLKRNVFRIAIIIFLMTVGKGLIDLSCVELTC